MATSPEQYRPEKDIQGLAEEGALGGPGGNDRPEETDKERALPDDLLPRKKNGEIDYNELARSFIDDPEKYVGHHQDIANRLIEAGESWAVADNIDKFSGLDHQDVVNRLIEAGEGWVVADNIDKFSGLDHQDVVSKLIEADKGWAVVGNLDKFSGLDHQDIANRLIEADQGWVVVKDLDRFSGLDHQKTANKLIEADEGSAVTENLNKFFGLDSSTANKLIEAKYGRAVVVNLDKFSGLDHQDVVNRLIEVGEGWVVVDDLDKFSGLDSSTANKLIEAKYGRAVADNLDKFSGLDHQEIANKLIEAGKGQAVADNLDKFSGLDHQDIANRLIETGRGQAVADNLDKFSNIVISSKLLQKRLDDNGNFDLIYKLYTSAGDGKLPILEKTYEIFGEFATHELYRMLNELMGGSIHKELQKIGVSKTGESGLNQLKPKIKELQHAIITDADAALLETSALAREFLMKAVSFKTSEWGEHDEKTLLEMIRAHNNAEIKQVSGEYKDDTIHELSQRGKKEKQDNAAEWQEDEEERYLRLRSQLQSAVELLEQGTKPFTKALSSVEKYISEKTKNLETAKARLEGKEGKEKALENIDGQIEALKQINLHSLESFESNFVFLARDKKLHDDISAIMFAWALRRPPGGRDAGIYNQKLEAIRGLPENPSIESFSFVIDQIDHVTNQEVFGTYFTTKEAKKEFSGMTSVKTLSSALVRVQGNQKRTGVVPTFDATRGMLMELSGHIGDACWANKYDSIAEEFPNFTSVIIRQHPDARYERLVGSFILIEAESKSGEPLLIVRGLNPKENFVNRVDVVEFYDAVVDYVKNVAEKLDRKPAIVIDNHSGGSGTNRPVLFGYLQGIQPMLDRVEPDNETTNLNGYNITRDTYLMA